MRLQVSMTPAMQVMCQPRVSPCLERIRGLPGVSPNLTARIKRNSGYTGITPVTGEGIESAVSVDENTVYAA
ncbi:MAG: hypothetical protein ACLFRY_11495 [Spirochaetia bacterium]